MRQGVLWKPNPETGGDRDTIKTKPFGPQRVIRLRNRRVYMTRTVDESGTVEGWCVAFKRLATQDERDSTGKRVVLTQVHLSDEALWAMVDLILHFNPPHIVGAGEFDPREPPCP